MLLRSIALVTMAVCAAGLARPVLAGGFSDDPDFAPPDATFFNDTDFSYANPDQNVVLRGSIGVASITANEHVYAFSTGTDNLSLLQWVSTAPIASVDLKARFGGGWTLRGGIDAAIGGKSVITDYDWTSYSPSYEMDDWDHRSISPDTSLDWYLNGEVAFGRDLPINDAFTVNVNAGASYTDAHWTANGGSYIYSSGGFRNDVGNLPAGRVGDYRQQFPVIFGGVDTSLTDGPFSLDVGGRAGLIPIGVTTDNHYLRDLRIVDVLKFGQVLSADAKLGINISDNLNAYLEGKYQKMFAPHLESDYYDTTSGADTISDPSIGGAELDAASLMIGIRGNL